MRRTNGAMRVAAASGFSRIPLYDETLDHVVGVVYAKDLLPYLREGAGPRPELRSILRTPLFVPESMSIDDLLHEFQRRKVHIAVVLDEYGGTAGIVTIEDLLEEIVGEIQDEFDEEEPMKIEVGPGEAIVDGRADIDELVELIDPPLELEDDEEYDTLGGFVYHRIGRVPVGEPPPHDPAGDRRMCIGEGGGVGRTLQIGGADVERADVDTEGGEADGQVTVDEMVEFLEKKMTEKAREIGKTTKEKELIPFVLGGRGNHYRLSVNPEAAKKVQSTLAAFKAKAGENAALKAVETEGVNLLESMPRLKAMRNLRKEYEKLAEGGTACGPSGGLLSVHHPSGPELLLRVLVHLRALDDF